MTKPALEDNGGARARWAAAWTSVWPLIDRQLSPLGLPAIDALALRPGEAVLDVGCGAGQTCLQLAERVGEAGQVIGVDISDALLDIARQRAAAWPQVRLIHADAQRIGLADGGCDAVFSRFGVMGFADPVAASGNLRRMLRPGGRLAFVCWRALAENELDRLPLAAAGLEAAVDATPFSLADPAQIRRVLAEAGFAGVEVEPRDAQVSCGGLEETLDVLLKVGPLGRLIRETPALRDEAEPRVRDALARRGDPARISLGAAVWIVSAFA